jgi:hypothetical protein
VDYLAEDPKDPSALPAGPGDLELEDESADSSAQEGAQGVDPLLKELLPEDRNARRRVVTALLRAVLAERKIT